jgi:hypothetical protein
MIDKPTATEDTWRRKLKLAAVKGTFAGAVRAIVASALEHWC